MMIPASAVNVQLSILHKAMYLSVEQAKDGNIGVLSALHTLGICQVHLVITSKQHGGCMG